MKKHNPFSTSNIVYILLFIALLTVYSFIIQFRFETCTFSIIENLNSALHFVFISIFTFIIGFFLFLLYNTIYSKFDDDRNRNNNQDNKDNSNAGNIEEKGVQNNENKDEVNEIKPELKYLLQRAWFIIFTLGMWALMLKFYYEYINEPEKIGELAEDKWNWISYVGAFMSKEGYYIFGVVLATIFVDFIILFFERMSQLHNNVEKFESKINSSIKQLDESLKNSIIDLNASIGKQDEAIRNQNSNIDKTKDIEDILMKMVSSAENEAEFMSIEKFNNLIIKKAYFETIINLRKAASKEFLKYKESNDIITNTIPAIYTKEIFKGFNEGQFFRNFSNFGVMSQMVFELLNKKEIFHNEYIGLDKSVDVKIVFLTTLTLLPEYYLDPSKLKLSEHVIKEWNDYRRFFRKGCYLFSDSDYENGLLKRKIGEMLDFKLNKEKYKFIRVALLGDVNENSSDKIPISTKTEFAESLGKETFYHKIYKSNFPVELPENIAILNYDKNLEKKLLEETNYPFFADNISIPNSNFSKKKVGDLFIELYHSEKDDARYFELNDESAKKITGLTTMNKSYFKELFKEIPIDIFAVGVEINSEVNWKGAIAGYLGNNFEYMDLTWMDKMVNKEIWNKTEKFIQYLFDNSKENLLENLYSHEDLSNEETKTKVTNFVGRDNFEFSREHSLLIEFIKEKIKSNTKPKPLEILEIGGYYGRDALELAVLGNVTIIDNNQDSKLKFNQFMSEAKNSLIAGYFLKQESDDIWKLNENKIEYKINAFVEYVNETKYDIICSYNVLHRFQNDEFLASLKKCKDYLIDKGSFFHIFVSDLDIKNTHNNKGYGNCEIFSHSKESILGVLNNIEIEYRHILEYDYQRAVHPHVMWYLYYENKNETVN
jgi:hypothetical protein